MKAAPEGVAMETVVPRTHQEYLDSLASPIDQKKRETLETVCTELGLDREAFEHIEFEARLLRDFEAHGKSLLKTPRERIKTLEKVEKLAKALNQAMQEFDTADQVALWNRLPETKMLHVSELKKRTVSVSFTDPVSGGQVTSSIETNDPDCIASYSNSGGRMGRVGHIGLEVENLANAAYEERLSLGDAGKKGGRKSTLRQYAVSVAAISDFVKASKMTIGRGGKFEKLCEAVFEAAGLHASPEGAIREFMEYGNLYY